MQFIFRNAQFRSLAFSNEPTARHFPARNSYIRRTILHRRNWRWSAWSRAISHATRRNNCSGLAFKRSPIISENICRCTQFSYFSETDKGVAFKDLSISVLSHGLIPCIHRPLEASPHKGSLTQNSPLFPLIRPTPMSPFMMSTGFMVWAYNDGHHRSRGSCFRLSR